MGKVLLFQLDGKLPNLALMRIAAHHRAIGHDVELRHGNPEQMLFDEGIVAVYGSAIFEKTRPAVDRLRRAFPNAIIGGTGVDMGIRLEHYGITTQAVDYSIYPDFQSSIGFSQRGCRLSCEFCVVPRKEGRVKPDQSISEIWRGGPWPKQILLLDNDFFGQPSWRDRICEMREGGFKVSFIQGINARCITDEAAESIASVDYRDDSFSTRRIYTAWDNKGDEARLFDGLKRLVKYGVRPDNILVYMLVGYWPGETEKDRDYRRAKLREFGARPYPMPFVRTPELVGFQRWVVGAYDKRIAWKEWAGNRYRPEGIGSTFPILQEA